MKKNILIFLSLLFSFISCFAQVPEVTTQESEQKAQEKVIVYFFWGKGCSHCKDEKAFLEKMALKYPNIEVKDLEVWYYPENMKLLVQMGKEMKIDVSSMPITIIDNQAIFGFYDEQTTGIEIENAIVQSLKKYQPEEKVEVVPEKKEKVISLPIVGEIELKNISLPLLTVIIGAIDGFNPCAMWALVMLLSFLIAVKNRKKMFLLGFLFILVSAIVYFLFMVAWLNFIIFISYINWVKILIGLVAIIGGVYYLKEFWVNKEGACKATNTKFKQNVSSKMSILTENKKLGFAIIGIILLAFFVNLIELICSAGLPVVYLQVLSLSSVTPLQHYLYILLYIFIFMLDDLLIFTIAFFSFSLLSITSKYSRFSHLIGGVVLLILGALLIFKPEFLMF